MEHKLKATGGEAVTKGELEPENGKTVPTYFFLNKDPLVTYLLLVFVPSILTWLGSYTSQVIQAVTFF